MSFRYIAHVSLTLLVIGIILTVLVLLFNKWLRYKERSWAFELKRDNNKALASLRITAYERITIMLERLAPQALVMRLSSGASSAGYLQMDLMKAIREEFEHNVSLQMYVSPECWLRVERARDEVSELIKVAYTKVRPDSPAVDLSRAILFLENEVGNGGLKDALKGVRLEMAQYF